MKFTIRKSDNTFEKVEFKDLTSIQQDIILGVASKNFKEIDITFNIKILTLLIKI